ncbi:HEAT repeat domain-containing protein [Bacillus sp. 22-7]|uniref:HEAT repeat domain-containing protein n=1 Tax=Bacillus sp. 22-7 TaxID=2709707 RepID=UPI0013D54618|nr:HEAT repeat domain-containing protein [Bacillus sp. 22-7]
MEQYIEQLRSTNIGIRKKAVESIIEEKVVSLVPDLYNISKNGPTYAKVDALNALGNILSEDEVNMLDEFLKDKDWHMRLQAITCIYNLLGKKSYEILTPFLKDKAYGVRSEVEKLLHVNQE